MRAARALLMAAKKTGKKYSSDDLKELIESSGASPDSKLSAIISRENAHLTAKHYRFIERKKLQVAIRELEFSERELEFSEKEIQVKQRSYERSYQATMNSAWLRTLSTGAVGLGLAYIDWQLHKSTEKELLDAKDSLAKKDSQISDRDATIEKNEGRIKSLEGSLVGSIDENNTSRQIAAEGKRLLLKTNNKGVIAEFTIFENQALRAYAGRLSDQERLAAIKSGDNQTSENQPKI